MAVIINLRSRFVPTGQTFLQSGERTRDVLAALWRNPRVGAAASSLAVIAWGVLAGWWTPRGPLTTGEALWSITLSLLVGLLAGFAWRSRWAVLAAPVTFATVFEVIRLAAEGPTVDQIETSTYGILALIVGRGFHAFVSLVPLALGATFGVGAARRLIVGGDGAGSKGLRARRTGAILATVPLIALVIGIARPATTEPILDDDGSVLTGSVAELRSIDVNGHDLHLMVRGHDTDNPVLLFLAGGPGGSEMGAMRNHLPDLEKYFTVVTWDQRGAGKSYNQLDPTDTTSAEGYVNDTVAVTDYLRERFNQDKIYLMGQSWGSTLGVLAVQQHPDRYVAFIGTGQMVSARATDTIFYQDTLQWARAAGKEDLVWELTRIGPPPYDRMLNYETALSYEHQVYPYDHSGNSEGEGAFSENFLVSEYALIDQVHLLGAFMDTFSVLYPKVQDIDFRDSAVEFEIPVFFVQGAHEAGGRAELFNEWYPQVKAPLKDLAVFDRSGHRPLFEQPDEFVGYMVNTVLAQTEAE